jgi:Fe-S cluster assembly ATPase SufC
MIQKIEIDFNQIKKNPTFYYVAERIPNFPKVINFEKHTNLLIGENGAGKTTIIEMIRNAAFCEKTFKSIINQGLLNLQLERTEDKLNGIDIYGDWQRTVFNLRTADLLEEQESFYSLENFQQTFVGRNLSRGEALTYSIKRLLKTMFDKKSSNEFMLEKIESKKLQEYYVEHSVYGDMPTIQEAPFTVLMDEPDNSLDIDNLEQVFDILNITRDDTQLIVSIHNPLLIYRASKNQKVNFIELTEGYLNKIINFVEKS